MILDKYTRVKRLGKGGLGDVFLVQDQSKKLSALKMISKKFLEEEPYWLEYLENEKDCLMNVKSRYIVQLQKVQEDENYWYYIFEYCDSGDLLNYHAKQPNKVFTFEKATKILSQIIRALQQIHQKGYIHRDLKPQTILLKTTGKADQYNFLLSGLSFAVKREFLDGTVLGTEKYMSPEMYEGENYSFEVDMWAFGVLFYFMLNLQFPFKINPHQSVEQKQDQLIKQAKQFSFCKSVEKSKKKITENCTKEVEDLFGRIFTPDRNDRITFCEIRAHPVFREHFPIISDKSKALYNKTKNKPLGLFPVEQQDVLPHFGIKIQQRQKQKQKQNIQAQIVVKKSKSVQFEEQNIFVSVEYDKIKFLTDAQSQIINSQQVLETSEILMIRYCFLKYYIIFLKQFSASLKPSALQKKKPQLKWRDFCKSNQFKNLRKHYQDQLHKAEQKIKQVYDLCEYQLNQIRKINPTFEENFDQQVSEKQLPETFQQAYMTATAFVYAKLKKALQNNDKFVYLTAIVAICHVFKRIVKQDEKQLLKIFKNYMLAEKIQQQAIDLAKIRYWMSRNKKSEALKPVISEISQKYFLDKL